MKYLLVALAMLSMAAHAEDEIVPVLSVASHHFGDLSQELKRHKLEGFNEFNYGLGLHLYNTEHDAYRTFGMYLNSLYETSFYAGAGWRSQGWLAYGIEGGIVTGYPKPVIPYVVPTLWLGPAKVIFIPEVKGINPANTIGLQVEIRL